MNKKVLLLILDGWGITQNPKYSAISNAKIPFINDLYNKFPNGHLRTDGEHVGLPDGQMGNSEVGHINLGTGRIVYQNLAKINKALRENTLAEEKELVAAFAYAKKNNKAVHFVGLVSDGGIHAHINHLKGLLDASEANDVEDVFVHAFTDGRDCDPKSGSGFIADIDAYSKKKNATLASVTGRYYAMDRDNRWERVKLAYDALVNGEGELSKDAVKSIEGNYKNGVTDEFVKPIILVDENQQPKAKIKKDDVVIFFNLKQFYN